jgi:hypothetical protein
MKKLTLSSRNWNRVIVLLVVIVLSIGLAISGKNLTSAPARQPTVPFVQPLSVDAYKKVENKLTETVTSADPRKALELLQADMDADAAVLRSCHGLAHAIGHAAFKRYGTFAEAMLYQQETCNSGYVHGVIEQAMADADNPLAVLQSLCGEYPEGSFKAWECYHGSGHGFMFYTGNELPKALSFCAMNRTDFERTACVNGVFMENFNTDQKIHPSRYLRAADPLYPCAEQHADNKHECYFYATAYFLTLHPGSTAKAMDWCRTAEAAYRNDCFVGLGADWMGMDIKNPGNIEAICLQAVGSERAYCISGMASLYLNHYGSLTKAKEMCTMLKPESRAVCEVTLKGEATKFIVKQ